MLFRSVYAPPGYLLFVRRDANSGVWAAPFTGGPLDLFKAVRVEAGAARFTAADEGTLLVSIRPSTPSKAELVWVDRHGEMTGIPGPSVELDDRSVIPNLALSPDERRVAFVGGPANDVFVRDLVSGLDTRLTFDQRDHNTPAGSSWFRTGWRRCRNRLRRTGTRS